MLGSVDENQGAHTENHREGSGDEGSSAHGAKSGATKALAPTGSRVAFVTRNACPTCGSVASVDVWSGRFDDPDVRQHMTSFHYSGGWADALTGADFALARCTGCGMLWHRKVIAPEWVPVVYGEWADAAQAARFEAAHVDVQHNLLDRGVQRIKLVLRIAHLLGDLARPPRLLDFGCGDGTLLLTAQGLGMDVGGIDVSASRSASLAASGVPVWPDLAARDEDRVAPADAVVLSQVLEHLADPLGLLRALHARMAPGSVLFAAVPDCTGITVPDDFDSFHKVAPIEHMNGFTPATLTAICRRAGFAPIQRPTAIVTTRPRRALRSAVNWVWDPKSTDQFFRRAEA